MLSTQKLVHFQSEDFEETKKYKLIFINIIRKLKINWLAFCVRFYHGKDLIQCLNQKFEVLKLKE